MVDSSIATYLANNTSLALGSDLFLATLPREDRDGVTIRLIREIDANGLLAKAFMSVFCIYASLAESRNRATTIATLMRNREGTLDGTWAVADGAVVEYSGQDALNRHVYSVDFIATYTQDSL